VQPFLVDKNLSQQGFATSEPFSIEKGGVKPVVFLLAEQGYPPYSEVLAVRRDTLGRRADALKRFVTASAEGWKSYLENPAPGNALIKRDNPQMTDELLAYGHAKMKEYAIVTGSDTTTLGLLTMTDKRWQQTVDFLRSAGLAKAGVDYASAWTLSIVNDVKVYPERRGRRDREARAVVSAGVTSGADKVYANGTTALAPVDLVVERGEFVTLLGPSGCGKTTLLNLIAGLVTPTHGSLTWWGGATARRGGPGRRLGFVFQSPTLMPWARSLDNVRLPLDLAASTGPAIGGGCRRASRSSGLRTSRGTCRASSPAACRCGRRSRARSSRAGSPADGRAVRRSRRIHAPAPRRRARALWLLRKLTVVFVTHSIYEAVFLSTRVVVMSPRPGRIVADVAIDEPFPRRRATSRLDAFARHCQRLSGADREPRRARVAA
jgi:ABC-type nitrate/sulfonate/bicarbonate transport system ATPase subunit